MVEAAGITFIGPKPKAIEMMGSKLAAKEAAKAYDIPMVPGTDGAIADVAEAIATAKTPPPQTSQTGTWLAGCRSGSATVPV